MASPGSPESSGKKLWPHLFILKSMMKAMASPGSPESSNGSPESSNGSYGLT